MINLGFSGTREGMTEAQVEGLRRAFELIQAADPDPEIQLHHGDCVGADAQADELAKALNIYRVAYPPVDDRYRAFCAAEHVLPPAPYLTRNHAIVKACNWLIICPKESVEQAIGSGTWATKRYAKKASKPVLAIYPDGTAYWL